MTHSPDASRPDAVPDVFLVGAPKCATTALASWLALHPECAVTVPKEPHYWSFDLPGLRRTAAFEDPKRYSQVVKRARSEARVVIDASTTYLMSSVAVPEILRSAPDAKFVAIVRDPAELIPSYFQTQRNSLNETESSLARALQLTARRRSGLDVPERCADPGLLDYELVGTNGAHVERLLSTVGEDRVQIIVYDDLRDAPEQVWSELCRFLGVEVTATRFEVIHVGGRRPRFGALHSFVHRPPKMLERLVAAVRQRTQEPRSVLLRRVKRVLWKPTARPVVDAQAVEILSDWFVDDVGLLSRVLDRDLSHWLRLEPSPPAP